MFYQKGGISFAGRNYYKVLGVAKNATPIQIKKTYRKLAMKVHPDRHKGEEKKYEEIFKELNHAHGVLSDKKLRERYDMYILIHPPKTPPKSKPRPRKTKPQPKPSMPKSKPKSKTPPKKSPPKSKYIFNERNIKDIIENDRLTEFKLHIKEGLNMNSTVGNVNNSLLMYSIIRRAPKIGKFLVENGANVNKKNGFGDTPLIEAASSGYNKIVKFLLKRKAKTNIKNDMRENALFKAVVGHNITSFSDKEQKAKYISIIKKLFDFLSPVNIIPIQEKHLVFHIIDTERLDIFKLAIIEGIKQDRDVLLYLLEKLRQSEGLPESKDFISMLKILLKTGIKPKYLLHKAANVEIAKLLMKHGDIPTDFYDNKKFESKEVKNFIYPLSPSKKKSPLNSSKYNFDDEYIKLRKRRKELEKKMKRNKK